MVSMVTSLVIHMSFLYIDRSLKHSTTDIDVKEDHQKNDTKVKYALATIVIEVHV